MARRLPNGYLELSDGRVLAPNSLIILHDIPELVHAHSFGGFVSGGGGQRGPAGAVGAPGPVGPPGPPGPECIPARTLFVAQSWPAGCDPTVFFTDIPSALAQAATLTPTINDSVAIIIYPGAYSADLTLVSNVSLSSASHLGAIITGSVTWTPGSGVNAPQTSVREALDIRGVEFEGPIAIDASSKTSEKSLWKAVDCEFVSATTLIGRGVGDDEYEAHDCLHNDTFFDATDYEVFLFDTSMLDVFSSGGSITIQGGQLFDSLVADTSTVALGVGTVFTGLVFVDSGATFDAQGCRLLGGVAVIDVSASADIRGAEFFSSFFGLFGPGPINRSVETLFFGPTVAGPNVVSFAAPYPDTFYTPIITEFGAPAGAPPATALALGTASFTLDDSVGGRSFAVGISKE